ncbi:hypothetical protein BT93_F2320 [Corymbia citriodora subsp. variegata]|nr:hypothetical protein BT93_F2320 [Corymbia citriodora subsp. variegata]
MEGELQDWELLHGSDSDSPRNPRSLDVTEDDESGGMIRPDYFSLHGSAMAPPALAAATAASASASAPASGSEAGDSVHSDNPSWIDPGSETRYQRKDPGGFWSDSGSDLSDERKLGDFDPKGELLVAAAEEIEAAGGLGGKSEKSAFGLGEFDLGDLGVKDEYGFSGSAEKQVDVGEIRGLGEDSPKFWSAPGGERLAPMKLGEDVSGEEGFGIRNDQAAEAEGGNEAVEDESLAIKAAKPEGDEDKRRTVWWKVPFELLRFCVFRVSPFWSLSVAAAFMGCVILGRRLYKMKQRTRTLQLKITVDDKKVSQFTSRAARLNEAFSVVRRVPVVRPSLPAAGVAAWPVMSLR